MLATEQLRQEHEAIKLMLAIMKAVVQRAEAGERIPPEDLTAIVDFIRTFADRCHHGKEERCLFPAMERVGVPREGGPIGVMLQEHEFGRAFVRQIQEASDALARGDSSAAEVLRQSACGYIALLERHIDKENNILYPIANMHLTPEEHGELLEQFERLEREQIGPRRHEQFHTLLQRLQQHYLAAAAPEHVHRRG